MSKTWKRAVELYTDKKATKPQRIEKTIYQQEIDGYFTSFTTDNDGDVFIDESLYTRLPGGGSVSTGFKEID